MFSYPTFTVFQLIYLLAVLLSFYGFGSAVNTLLRSKDRNIFTSIMLGVSLFLAVASLLSAIHLFVGLFLDLLIYSGAIYGAYIAYHRMKAASDSGLNPFGILVRALVVVGIMATMLSYQPPSAFNLHDDLQRYFAHPVRMLQTGTTFGNPLDTLGVHLPGGAAALQALIISHFSIASIDIVDSVIGLSLCILGLISVIPITLRSAPIIGVCVLGFVMINPQYVNVTPIYMPAAFMLACIMTAETYISRPISERCLWGFPVSLGLLYAGLISLKLNYILFPAIHFAVLCTVLLYLKATKAWILTWSIRIVLTAVLASGLWFLPWLLYSMTDSHDSFIMKGSSVFMPVPSQISYIDVFSVKPLLWGGAFLYYTLLAIGALLPVAILVVSRFAGLSDSCRAKQLVLSANSITVFISFALMVMSGPFLFGYEETLRYAIPFLMANVFLMLLLLYKLSSCYADRFWRASVPSISFMTAAIFLMLFYEDFSIRYSQMVNCGNRLGFRSTACSLSYKSYTKEALSSSASERVTLAQSMIPAGADFLAWIGTPFLLDFSRNNIYNVGGVSLPWAKMPNVNYFMFEYTGEGDVDKTREMKLRLNDPAAGGGYRADAIAGLSFWNQMLGLMKSGSIKIIYDDGRIRVYKR